MRTLRNLLQKNCVKVIPLLLFFTLIWIYEHSPVKLVIAKDVSLPYNFFLELPPKDSYEKGEYVEFVEVIKIPYLAERFSNPVYLIKIVACKEGDELKTENLAYYCNGKRIAKAMEKTPKGRQLPHFEFNGVIPKGFYFVVGKHPMSFDSRYLGLIHKSQIKARVVPLW